MCTKRPDHQFERQPRLGWRVPAPLLSSKAPRERAWDKRKLLGNLVQGIPPWGVDGLGVKAANGLAPEDDPFVLGWLTVVLIPTWVKPTKYEVPFDEHLRGL